MERFHNLSATESAEKPEPAQAEQQPSPERGALFAETVEKIKTNKSGGIKLLTLMERGYLPSQEELRSIDVQRAVAELRKKYPTVEDIQRDLARTVNTQIGVAYRKGWTQEQYQQAIRDKKTQYKREAVSGIVASLNPVYERFGAVASDENKARIIENLTSTIKEVHPRNISASERDYVKKKCLGRNQPKSFTRRSKNNYTNSTVIF